MRLRRRPQQPPPAPRAPGRLEVRDVAVDFGGIRALAGVDVAFPPGAVTGIIGPNGSGKTTLLDVISGVVAATAGRVLLDGIDLIDHLPEDRSAEGLLRSFQDARLYPELTVEETLLVAEDARRRPGVLSVAAGLPGARRSEHDKLATVERLLTTLRLDRYRHHRIAELSTGTRRIADLAIVLATRPRVLLLDEPTAGIAQREAEAFAPLLRRLHKQLGATVLLVEHDVPLVMSMCDHVVVLEAGRVVAQGTPDEVTADPAAIAAYLGATDEALARSGATTH